MPVTSETVYDEWLVLRSQDGDLDALGRLVTRWQERLHRHALRLVGHEDDARDVVQDSWVAVARSIRRLDDPAQFRAWIYRIVTHKSADRIRKSQRDRKVFESRKELAQQHDHSDSSDAVALVRQVLHDMPTEQRTLLRLHYLEGLGVRELGIVFDIPPGTVKSRLFHARKKFAHILERNES